MVEDANLNAIETGIFAALNVAGVTGDVPAAQHYNMLAPPDASYPVIIVQTLPGDREGEGMGFDAQTLPVLVKCITKGEHSVATAGKVQNAIHTALAGVALTITGFTSYAFRRVSWFSFMEYEDQRQPIVHRGGIYKLYLHP